MARGDGQSTRRRRSLDARIRRLEKSQVQLEKQTEASNLELNKLMDRRDKDWRTFQSQITQIVANFRIMTEKTIVIYEMQEKSELRQDRFNERQINIDDQLAKLTEQVGKIAIEQAETTRKLNALLDLEGRRRSNGHNGKKRRD